MVCDKCGYNKAGCECPAVTVTWEQAAKSGVEINHKLHARIAELEQMVRELVVAVDQCFGNVAISMDDEIVWANTRRRSLALLQPEAGKEVGR